MNSDELKSLVTLLVTLICGALATHGVTVSTEDKMQMIGDLSIMVPATISFAGIVTHIVQHWNMKKVPENSVAMALSPGLQTPPVGSTIPVSIGVGKVVGAILLSILFLPHNARAATRTPQQVLQAIHDDAVAASADALSNNDTIAKTCYDAIALDTQMKLSTAQIAGAGVLTVFQKARDVSRLNVSPAGTALIVGCAPLVQDSGLSFAQFFTKIGAAVLLKGIVPGQ